VFVVSWGMAIVSNEGLTEVGRAKGEAVEIN